MTRPRSLSIGLYAKFSAMAIGVGGGMILLGYLPTMRLGGSGAVRAMIVACGISLIGSLVGAVPVVRAASGPAARMSNAILLSMALRFLVVILLALSAALSGLLERLPLLLWVAISYLMLLVTDTLFAVRVGGSVRQAEK